MLNSTMCRSAIISALVGILVPALLSFASAAPGGGQGGRGAGRVEGGRSERAGEGRGDRGGGEDRPRHRPMFGVITAVGADSITLKPEVPEFVKQLAPKRAEKAGQRELPESITVALDDMTRFVTGGGEPGGSNPFAVGDRVAILAHGRPGDHTAEVVSDYATAQQRMERRRERREEKREGRGGKGGKRGKGGRGNGEGGGSPLQ